MYSHCKTIMSLLRHSVVVPRYRTPAVLLAVLLCRYSAVSTVTAGTVLCTTVLLAAVLFCHSALFVSPPAVTVFAVLSGHSAVSSQHSAVTQHSDSRGKKRFHKIWIFHFLDLNFPYKVFWNNSKTLIKYNKMHVFVNEGETILKEFVVNVSENIVHSKNLISFMKSNNILNSKILKKKRDLIKKDILEQLPIALQEKVALLKKYKNLKLNMIDNISDETRNSLIEARKRSSIDQIEYLWKKFSMT